jgi:hypothetical protein
MSSKNRRKVEDLFEHGAHLLAGGSHHARVVSNYVAKLKGNVLRAKGLKPLGHIFNFATLRIKCG